MPRADQPTPNTAVLRRYAEYKTYLTPAEQAVVEEAMAKQNAAREKAGEDPQTVARVLREALSYYCSKHLGKPLPRRTAQLKATQPKGVA